MIHSPGTPHVHFQVLVGLLLSKSNCCIYSHCLIPDKVTLCNMDTKVCTYCLLYLSCAIANTDNRQHGQQWPWFCSQAIKIITFHLNQRAGQKQFILFKISPVSTKITFFGALPGIKKLVTDTTNIFISI